MRASTGAKYLNLLLALTLFTPSLTAQDLDRPGIIISKEFSDSRVQMLSEDLNFLSRMNSWEAFDQDEQMAFGFVENSNKNLLSWISERVRYLIPLDSLGNVDIHFGTEEKIYPHQDSLPGDLENIYFVLDREADTLMSNLGTAYYLFGKRARRSISVNLSEHFSILEDPIEMTTPRKGIILFHENFFKSTLYVSRYGREDSDRILRLSYLFHEGRHSDGSGVSLGFYHKRCPPGTDYAGLLACDRASNGAYNLGAIFIKKSLEVCQGCGEVEKDILRMNYFDNKARVIDRKILTPEEVENINDLENLLNMKSLRIFKLYAGETTLTEEQRTAELEILQKDLLEHSKEIDSLRSSKDFHKLYWDETPEYAEQPNE